MPQGTVPGALRETLHDGQSPLPTTKDNHRTIEGGIIDIDLGRKPSPSHRHKKHHIASFDQLERRSYPHNSILPAEGGSAREELQHLGGSSRREGEGNSTIGKGEVDGQAGAAPSSSSTYFEAAYAQR